VIVPPSALRNDLDVEQYLTDVLGRLLHGARDYESMLPHVWRAAHPEAVQTYREDERRDASERRRRHRAERRHSLPLSAESTPEQQAEILCRAKAKLLADLATRAAHPRRPNPTEPASGRAVVRPTPRPPRGGRAVKRACTVTTFAQDAVA